MTGRCFSHTRLLLAFVILWGAFLSSCSPTKHLNEGEYLLRKNSLKIQSDRALTRRGELRENLERLIIQKPNTRLLGIIPYKVWLYNLRYDRYQKDSTNFQIESRIVEKPVVFDSLLMRRSADNMRSYLFNQGYFYPIVNDTVIYDDKKAYVTYEVQTGIRYLINQTILDVDDSTIYGIVRNSMSESVLKPGVDFSMSLLEQERSRITTLLREQGYFRFSQENIVDFNLDTFDNARLRVGLNPLDEAFRLISRGQNEANPTLDIRISIRADKPESYRRYRINRMAVFPDFISREDVRDSNMTERMVNGVRFRYHDYYIREQVVAKRLFLEPGKYYRQSDYDATINRLNSLGVFQTIRIVLVEDTSINDNPDEGWLNAYIVLSPAKKYDFTANFELSTGTTYDLGSTPTLTFRNRNLGKGANVLTTSVSGGIETIYDSDQGNNLFERFSLLTKTYSFTASLDLPKFLFPGGLRFTKKNAPRTLISLGSSQIERINFFTLTNTHANFKYNWRETSTKNWELSPAFINIIRLPSTSDSFNRRLELNDFLKNSYRETFIEGEQIGFTYDNQFERRGKSYSFAKFNLEEAGALISALGGLHDLKYAQYVKFDFDLRRYINYHKTQVALRFYGGVGIPYGQSPTLPYLKQYFVGGAYSIRGWRIRSLGPGSYFSPETERSETFIDRTGDIKLEWNGEFRFDVAQFFAGSIQLKGAVFTDAGNIWLSSPSANYPGGEFRFDKFGHDIAIASGLGARLDIASFIVLRFDAAFPVKVPYESGAGWRVGQIRPWSADWRKDNIILNIAVGYPF